MSGPVYGGGEGSAAAGPLPAAPLPRGGGGRRAPLPRPTRLADAGSPLALPTDEVNAVVLDIGSYAVKAGYAGEDTPKYVFPSVRCCRRLARLPAGRAATACRCQLRRQHLSADACPPAPHIHIHTGAVGGSHGRRRGWHGGRRRRRRQAHAVCRDARDEPPSRRHGGTLGAAAGGCCWGLLLGAAAGGCWQGLLLAGAALPGGSAVPMQLLPCAAPSCGLVSPSLPRLPLPPLHRL